MCDSGTAGRLKFQAFVSGVCDFRLKYQWVARSGSLSQHSSHHEVVTRIFYPEDVDEVPKSPLIEHVPEDPATFHARTFDTVALGPKHQLVWVPQLSARKTLVLGSAQRADSIDSGRLASRNIGLTARRSGGGAVLVSSVDLVWFDVVIDRNHAGWVDDVGQSFAWLGQACADGLAELGVNAAMHTGRLQASRWSSQICFASLGPGELTVDGRKVVGMSQRRTRERARFQVAILRHWSGTEHAAFLAGLSVEERLAAASELDHLAAGLPHSPDEILSAVVAQL